MSYFTETEQMIVLEHTMARVLCTVDPEAVAWDGADPSIKHALKSNQEGGGFSYCEVKFHPRARFRRFNYVFSHVVGMRCRVRFWNVGSELDGSGDGWSEWCRAVQFDRKRG